MQLAIEPGKYVVAVSGGVDSMALLDRLRHLPELKLVVAHFDHGIRTDSADDRKLVQRIAKQHRLAFVFNEGRLGEEASEATARRARYDFLRHVQQASGARGIITAHHQDDLLETAIINMIRGTGRRGLSSLRSHSDLVRPLLHLTKRQLHAYALAHRLEWREDSTNQDLAYLRNHVRKKVLPRFSIAQRQQLIAILTAAAETNHALDTQLVNYLHLQPQRATLDRADFVRLPHNLAREVLAAWLRQHGSRQFDRKMLERLVVAAKVGRPGSVVDISGGNHLKISAKRLALQIDGR